MNESTSFGGILPISILKTRFSGARIIRCINMASSNIINF